MRLHGVQQALLLLLHRAHGLRLPLAIMATKSGKGTKTSGGSYGNSGSKSGRRASTDAKYQRGNILKQNKDTSWNVHLKEYKVRSKVPHDDFLQRPLAVRTRAPHAPRLVRFAALACQPPRDIMPEELARAKAIFFSLDRDGARYSSKSGSHVAPGTLVTRIIRARFAV